MTAVCAIRTLFNFTVKLLVRNNDIEIDYAPVKASEGKIILD